MLTNTCIDIVSNALGFIGTGMVFFYGMPRELDTQGCSMLVVSQEDPDLKRKQKKYKLISHIGLIMLAFSFLIQVIKNLFYI